MSIYEFGCVNDASIDHEYGRGTESQAEKYLAWLNKNFLDTFSFTKLKVSRH